VVGANDTGEPFLGVLWEATGAQRAGRQSHPPTQLKTNPRQISGLPHRKPPVEASHLSPHALGQSTIVDGPASQLILDGIISV
jgi:hypothetical protein